MTAKDSLFSRYPIILWLFALALFLLFAFAPQPFPGQLTKVDFQVYWGASYLLGQSENFANPELLYQLQHELTGWDEDTPQLRMTWNPPWLLALLLPLTWLSFDRASWVWFVTNLALIFASSTLLWNYYATRVNTLRHVWLGWLAAFLFIPTLTTLFIGQISLLVLIGLVGFLWFWKRGMGGKTAVSPFLAGLSLSLTTVKPHLVYLVLPLLFLEIGWGAWQARAGQKKRGWLPNPALWWALAGFGLPILVGLAITFALRPTFLTEYAGTVAWGNLGFRTVPTLGFILYRLTGWPGVRWMGLLILPLVLVGWWLNRRRALAQTNGANAGRRAIPMDIWLPIALLLSVITAPFGWSFDQVVLLLPVQQMGVWLVEGRLRRGDAVFVCLAYLAMNGLALAQRFSGARDDAFFWLPIALLFLYLYAAWRSQTIFGAAEPDGLATTTA